MLKRLLLWTAVIISILRGTLCRGKQGHENPPPPPPPPPPSPGSEILSTLLPKSTPQHIPPPPLKPETLLPNQCFFGSENIDAVDSSEGYADANALYILANDPAECSGIVDSVEICYYITEVSSSIQFVSFRRKYSSNVVEAYRKLSTASLDVEINAANVESGEAFCDYLELGLSLSKGDVLGFITDEGFNVAIITSDDRDVFWYVPPSEQERRKRSSLNFVSELQSIPTTQLRQANTSGTPALRIVMNTTASSSQVFPTPTAEPTETPSTDPCSSDRERTISLFAFAAAMVASAVMIVALFVVVFILCCCLCGCCVCCGGCCDCKICKTLRICCKGMCSCCRRKGADTQKGSNFAMLHISPSESSLVIGIHDQSMQYNELYMPTDPAKVISGGLKQSTKLHENPAYGQQTTSQSSSDRGGLEHTYESIEVSRPRNAL